ncbi:MAG TPA: hypothetical protein VGO55_05290 [Allosphingosinicella sp.]|jgi:hypothetical protein|nr:hypothetical protein [Allosphingosinicella sp.]
MREIYQSDIGAHLTVDENERVRAIRHSQKYWPLPSDDGVEAVLHYLRDVGEVYRIPPGQLDNLAAPVEYLAPREQAGEYRLSEEKHHFDAVTYGFAQTYLNVPVWHAGLKVTVKQDPGRVIRSEDTSAAAVEAELPPDAAIEPYRQLFVATGKAAEAETGAAGAALLASLFGLDGAKAGERDRAPMRLIRGRFWIYRYDERARFGDPKRRGAGAAPEALRDVPVPQAPAESRPETPDGGPALPFRVPPPDPGIRDGADYLAAEITFEVATEDHRHTWRALVELETGSILYLRPLSACVDALVFENDPITKTGDTALNSTSDNDTLNPHVDDITLQNLDGPVGDIQSLIGTYANVTQVEGINIPVPTKATGIDFDYDVRTDDFASVSGYFHVDRIFRIIEDLGFPVSDYMANTSFPVPVDIRCYDDNVINAHCVGDGLGGIGHVGYGLMDLTDLMNPLGRACDPRVHLHEVLGHGILFEHVDDAYFNFAHSAGDGLSGIYFDPTSNCKGVDGTPVNKPGDLRFTYVPWHPSLNRRFDRAVASGWAWGGSQDTGGGGNIYGSEEILATTHFNIYRSIGGDSVHLGRRQFASRMMMYLILRAIQNLTPATNPNYARDFAAELMAVDALNWTSEGIYGGAYHKVIRWAFEKQGEYQSPLIVNGGPGDGTIVSAGSPPDVDVYIDDGRAGEYPYQPVHWHTTAIWNRRLADGVVDNHQQPALNETNFAYVKIKNRGTQQATDVVVRAYHTKAGAGLNWPADFEALATAQIDVGTVEGNNAEEKIVGPFEWTPTINAYGHDCMLMVVSAAGDPSNVDNFTVGETIPEWRLVPNDNNIGQRNVAPVPGGGGESGLVAGLDRISFVVGNPNPRRAWMTIDVTLPEVLRKRGWRIELEGVPDKGFDLEPGAKREIVIGVHPGAEFATRDIQASADRDIQIAVLGDDNVIGGMTYRLDPDIRQPFNSRPAHGGHGQDPERGGPMRSMVTWLIVAALAIAAIIVALTRWPMW